MSEYAPQSETTLPQPEALYAAIDNILATEVNPLERAYLYVAGMQAGDVRHVADGKLSGSLANIYFRSPRFGSSSAALDLLESGAKGMGELHRRGLNVIESASQLATYAAQVCGARSVAHNKVVTQLVEDGIAGDSYELLEHFTPDNYRPAVATGTRGTFYAERHMHALVRGLGIDVLADGTPYREVNERIWKDEGTDPKYFGHTYYLAHAYAARGNVTRTYELLHELQSPDKHVRPLLSLAEHATNPGVRTVAENEAARLAAKLSGRLVHTPQSVAEYYARTGNLEAAEQWLGIGTYPEFMQARAWAYIYLRTGDKDARSKCMNGWYHGFTPNHIDAELLCDVALKDVETGWFDEGTTVPLATWQLIRADKGPLVEYNAQPLALMAEEFALIGNGEALAATLNSLLSPWSKKREVMQGLSAAAVGLAARSETPPPPIEEFPIA